MRSSWISWLSAPLAGLALSASFAPWHLWWLALLALTLLLWQVQRQGRPARWVFLFSLGYFGGGLHWVYISLHDYGGASLPFALGANLLLILLLSAFTTAAAWLSGRLAVPGSAFRLALFPFFWMLGEYGRAYFLSGFPWLSIGYSQQNSLFSALAPLGGVWLMGLATLASLALLLHLPPRRRPWLLLLPLLLYGLQRIAWVQPQGEALPVALVQGNIPQLEKFQKDRAWAQLDHHLALAERHPEAALIVFPETAITHFISGEDDALLQWLQRHFRARRQVLVSGLVYYDAATAQYYNSVWALGEGSGHYHKRHLLPFGEYLPLRPLFERFHDYVSIPMSDFSPGQHSHSLDVRGRAGVSICFEAAFGRELRQSLPAAEYLINVSNDGWFRGSIAYDQHLQMNQMRALELGREMARATNTGLTALIDVRGRIKALLPRDEAGVLAGQIQKYQGLTPYARWGNHPFEALMLLYAALLWRKRRHEAL